MAGLDLTDRIMKTPKPPCDKCHGACCRATSRWPYAVEIMKKELDKFPEAVLMHSPYGKLVPVLPYIDGKCVHLSDDNRCQIYDRRPQICQEFTCVSGYMLYSDGTHGRFLRTNPDVTTLIETTSPAYVEYQRGFHKAMARRKSRPSGVKLEDWLKF